MKRELLKIIKESALEEKKFQICLVNANGIVQPDAYKTVCLYIYIYSLLFACMWMLNLKKLNIKRHEDDSNEDR
jgi:hypothetical protein